MKKGTVTFKFVFSKLKHGIITTPKGAKCIVIPLEENKLYESKLGNISADFIGWPKEKPLADETHSIKQSFSKEHLDSLTEEQKKALPYFGDLKVWTGEEPGNSAAETAPTSTVAAVDIQEATNDLQF